MVKRILGFIVFGLLLLSTTNIATAQELAEESVEEPIEEPNNFGLAAGIKANSMGFGGELIFQVNPKFNLRLGGSYFTYTMDFGSIKELSENVNGESSVNTGGISLLGNYHLSKNFFLSIGGIYNLFEGSIFGIPKNSITVGNIEVEPEDVGRLDINIKPGMLVSPYAGLGFGRTISKNKVVSFAVEIGATYWDAPKVSFTTTGMLTPTSSPEQQKQLEENMSWFTIYPLVSFQIGFRIL
ncbi:MAG: hypothetical protein CVT92_09890 [Bacteroidetes bacterium HGW-Bacteroidetes-1]|nr:MAG: hypothetical protein CVT92_09890 [Bacteroidetes bacterium HGW-Bacteroidetes-1]